MQQPGLELADSSYITVLTRQGSDVQSSKAPDSITRVLFVTNSVFDTNLVSKPDRL